MPVYVVRLRQDGDELGAFVGQYVAHSAEQLEQLVEKCCPKSACEYAVLPPDNMYSPDPKAPGPGRLYDEAIENESPEASNPTSNWSELFFEDGSAEWKPFCEAPWRSET